MHHIAVLPRNYQRVFEIMERNPREGVRKIRDFYVLFTGLPQPLQEEFLGMVNSYPCHINSAMSGDFLELSEVRNLRPQVLGIVSRIITEVGKEHQRDMKRVLGIIASHNICVGKGELVKRQIEHLVGYDLTTIPEYWEQGHLDEKVIAEKREELYELLQKKRA